MRRASRNNAKRNESGDFGQAIFPYHHHGILHMLHLSRNKGGSVKASPQKYTRTPAVWVVAKLLFPFGLLDWIALLIYESLGLHDLQGIIERVQLRLRCPV